MALSSQSRAAIYTGLRDFIDEDAVEEMLTNFPARDVDEPVTRDFLDARLAEVEGRIIGMMDQRFAALNEKMDQRFAANSSEMNERFTSITKDMDDRFTSVYETMDQRFAANSSEMNQRFTALTEKMDQRSAALTEKMDQRLASNLRWTVGLILGLPTLAAALLSLVT